MIRDDHLGRLTFVSETGRKALGHIAEQLIHGNVVLFAGAGLSFNAPSKDGGPNRMPGWAMLAKTLLCQMESGIKDRQDVLKVADYYETAFGRKALVDAVLDAVKDDQHAPGRVHKLIAQLKFRELITTNYDTLIERAFRSLYVAPQVVVEGRDLVRRRQPPRIIKMNGCFERSPGNIVITGDDFLAHSERDPLIEVFVTKSFVESEVLFVGFSLDDPAFRAINERVLRTLGEHCPVAFSLQMGTGTTETAYWRSRQIQVIDLMSGEHSELENEERVFRVLDALLKVQRDAATAPRRRSRAPHEYAESADRKELNAFAVEAALRLLGADEAQVHALTAQDELAKTLSTLLGSAPVEATRFDVERLVVQFFCRATGLFDSQDPPVESTTSWEQIWRFADFMIDASRRRPLRAAVGADLAVLLALFAMQYAIVAPAVGDARQGEELMLRSASELTFTCLISDDMAIRSRYLFLQMLFAPLDELAQLVDCWTNQGSERDLVAVFNMNEARVEPTPDEYRLPILSFFGVLQERPVYYQRAAESLWSRELVNSSIEMGGSIQYESTVRYRYLVHLAQGHANAWPGVYLHQERLERVIGWQMLQDTDINERKTCGESLKAMITELARGWLFGSPSSVRWLRRTWQRAEVEAGQRRLGMPPVPWMTLIVAALLDVRRPFHERKLWRILEDAWHRTEIDPHLIMRYLARRVGTAAFTKYCAEEGTSRHVQSALAEHEESLATLTAWLISRIDEERQDSTLRQDAIKTLVPMLSHWLHATASDSARQHLLAVLTTMNCWSHEDVAPVFEGWVDRQLASIPSGSLPLADLDTSGRAVRDGRRVRLLLAHTRSHQKGLRGDVEQWLERWSGSDALDDRLLGEFAADVVDWMQEPTKTFDWISRAARIRTSPRLTRAVQALEPVASTPGLAHWVMDRLRNLSSETMALWSKKRTAYLHDFAAFASDFDAEARNELYDVIRQDLSPDAAEGALELAFRMSMSGDVEDRGRWEVSVNELVEKGACGRGVLAGHMDRLASGYAEKVQRNLLIVLGRRTENEHPDVIGWIADTIVGTDGVGVEALEEQLFQLLLSPRRSYAFAAATALRRIAKEQPEVIKRNALRFDRAVRVLRSPEWEGRFRSTSSFIETIELLSQPAFRGGVG